MTVDFLVAFLVALFAGVLLRLGAAVFFALVLGVVFFVAFLAAVFLAEVFLPEVLLAEVFLPEVFLAVFFAAGLRALDVGFRTVFLTDFLVAFFAVFLAGGFREVFFAAVLVEPLDVLFFELELRAAVFFAGLMGAGR